MTEPRPLEIIAEAGVNHNGDLDMAMRLVDAAVECGADWVKFQTFNAEQLSVRGAPMAAYQKGTSAKDGGEAADQLDMLKRLELSRDGHVKLAAHCRDRGIGFLSTPFDRESLRFLTDDLRLELLKLGSGDLTNAPLLLAAAQSGKRLYLSTGMSDLAMIEDALGVLAFGHGSGAASPSRAAFAEALGADGARETLARSVTLLHCVSAYPAPADQSNLRAIPLMAERFGLPVGYSDHTAGSAVAVSAVALGATVIEKHLTLDRSLPGPDHAASLDPDGFGRMVRECRIAAQALGQAVKEVRPCEQDVRHVARRSLVAAQPIKAGEIFSDENLTTKRPASGIDASLYFDWIGRQATRDYQEDDLIDE